MTNVGQDGILPPIVNRRRAGLAKFAERETLELGIYSDIQAVPKYKCAFTSLGFK